MKFTSKKIILSLLITVFVGGALTFLFVNDFGFIKYLKLKKEMKQIQTEIARADYILDSLKTEIDSLRKSKIKIEKVAREKFDMHGTNEKLLKVTEK